MSIPRKVTISCSKCGKSIGATMFESINTNIAKALPKQIISLEFFAVTCPHCNSVSYLEYDTLYHDIQREAMIWVLHKDSPDYFQKLEEIRALKQRPYKVIQIAENMTALSEKVSCLEAGRDDRIIELCKVFTVYNLLGQQPGFLFEKAFYTTINGTEEIHIFDKDGNSLYSILSDKTYDCIRTLYFGSNEIAQERNTCEIIDYSWAEQTLIPLLTAETKNTSDNTDNPVPTSRGDHTVQQQELRPKEYPKEHLNEVQKEEQFQSDSDTQKLSKHESSGAKSNGVSLFKKITLGLTRKSKE